MHSEPIVQNARAGLIVSPAASEIGNFNGVSTAVVVSSAPFHLPVVVEGGRRGGWLGGALCSKCATMC